MHSPECYIPRAAEWDLNSGALIHVCHYCGSLKSEGCSLPKPERNLITFRVSDRSQSLISFFPLPNGPVREALPWWVRYTSGSMVSLRLLAIAAPVLNGGGAETHSQLTSMADCDLGLSSIFQTMPQGGSDHEMSTCLRFRTKPDTGPSLKSPEDHLAPSLWTPCP